MYMRRAETDDEGSAIHHSIDGDSRFDEICSILTVGCVLSTLVVGLRSYVRLRHLSNFGWDDGVILVAQVLVIASAVAIGLESKYGLGRHTWVQPMEHFVPYMKSFYSSIIVYNIAMCLVKLSILIQYRRIFSVRMIQRATLVSIILLGAWTFTLVFLLTLICVPVAKFWDSAVPGKCLDSLLVWYIMASVNVATDFFIFYLPLPVINSLQLPRKQKIMLLSVFGLGLFTCIISIIRIRTLKIAASSKDPNWENVDAAIWSFLEVVIAVLAACLPTLRPIFARLVPRLFNSSLRRGHHDGSYGRYVRATDGSRNTTKGAIHARRTTTLTVESTRPSDKDDVFELASQHSPCSIGPPSSSGGYTINITAGKDLCLETLEEELNFNKEAK